MKRTRQLIVSGTCKLLFSLTFITCLFQSQAAFAQTLRPSANGRYVEWNGAPLFLLSDTAWLLPGRYSTSEVASHVASRKAQGYTAIQMTVCFPEVQNGAALQNINSIFTNGDMARPIESYFAMVDAKIRQVTDAGLIAIVNPFWKKASDTIISNNGVTKSRNYANWLAARHRNNPRVAWFIGGDDRPEPVRDHMNAMGEGVAAAYASAGLPAPIIAYHGDPAQSSREAFPTNPSWLTMNWTYAYSAPLGGTTITPVDENHAAWPLSPADPIMHGEGWYDRDNGASQTSRWNNRYGLRRQAWWAPLSGAIAGYAYGAEPIWLHRYNGITPATAVNWNSGRDAARMKAFLVTTEWWKLQPDRTGAFMTSSAGTSLERAVAALASDNTFGVAYTPTARSMTFRMPAGRTYTLRWYDPSSGAYRTGSVTGASGASVTMAHPGNNASGSPDWVVHVSSSGTPPPPPPPPPPGTIQAETAVLAGGVTVDNNNAGFNGTGFLNFPTTGGSAQFNSVNGGTGGSKTIAIRFANGSTTAASRTGRILVNGVAQNITFTSDQNWTNWRTLNVTATFNANTSNTIRFESTGQDLGNIDEITIP